MPVSRCASQAHFGKVAACCTPTAALNRSSAQVRLRLTSKTFMQLIGPVFGPVFAFRHIQQGLEPLKVNLPSQKGVTLNHLPICRETSGHDTYIFQRHLICVAGCLTFGWYFPTAIRRVGSSPDLRLLQPLDVHASPENEISLQNGRNHLLVSFSSILTTSSWGGSSSSNISSRKRLRKWQ